MAKRACSCELSNVDRISNLPANVTDQILASMPLKEAAKASLLSKKWRNRWRSIPVLVFDRKFGRLISPNKLNKLLMKIYRVLLLHNGVISKFVLSVPGLSPCPEIDHIILYLADKVSDEFCLRFGEYIKDKLPRQKRVWKHPAEAGSVVKTWMIVGFSKLKILELKEVVVSSDFLENFVPKCPLLEKLTLLNCHGMKSPKLVAPRLGKLFFHSSFEISFSFECAPVLSLVSMLDPDIYDYESEAVVEYDNHDMVTMFASIPALQQLNLGLELLILLIEAGDIPARLPAPVQHLTVLEIPKIFLSCLKDAQVLVCLMLSSPNLRTLTIRHDTGQQRPRGTPIDSLQALFEEEELELDSTDGCLGCLETLNIHNSQGLQVEMELVKFVLANAPQLRRVHITPSRDTSNKPVVKYLKEVIGYKRASREAQVIYDWNEENASVLCG